MSYAGTKAVERILRIGRSSKIKIATDPSEGILGTSDVRLFIEDADQYIDSILSDTVTGLPVSPTPDSLLFASKYMAAYYTHVSIYPSTRPNKLPDAVENWRKMATRAIYAYKDHYKSSGQADQASGQPAKWTESEKEKFATEKGVVGVNYGEREGVFEDEDITTKTE